MSASGTPRGLQLSRKRGARLPPGSVSVARPSRYGNDFRVGEDGTAAECVAKHREGLEHVLAADPGHLEPLRGKNLACWCGLDAPCHRNTLLELANAPARVHS